MDTDKPTLLEIEQPLPKVTHQLSAFQSRTVLLDQKPTEENERGAISTNPMKASTGNQQTVNMGPEQASIMDFSKHEVITVTPMVSEPDDHPNPEFQSMQEDVEKQP